MHTYIYVRNQATCLNHLKVKFKYDTNIKYKSYVSHMPESHVSGKYDFRINYLNIKIVDIN